MDKVLMASAVVTGLDGNTAHLRGVSPEGAPVDVDLPRLLVERQALAVGDRAWVFSQVAGGAALVEVTPALRVSVSKATAKRSQALPGVQCDIVWHAEAAPVGDDGLTDDERTAYARRYAATAGANLDAQQLSDIEQALADGEIPRRRFRPAG